MNFLRRDQGTTLVETTAVIALLSVVLAMLLGFLSSSQTNLERNISRSMTNDEVRLAVQSLDREVRSGNVLYNTVDEVYEPGDIVSGMAVRIYTQSNDAFKCVQWRVTSNAELQRRSWTPNWQTDPATLVMPWRTVATGIRNRADSIGPAFSRPKTNLLVIDLWSNSDPTAKKGKSSNVKVSISGRNTIFYSSNTLCGPAVPNPAITASDGVSRVPPY